MRKVAWCSARRWNTILESEKKSTYQIVGEDEADFKTGKISVGSPLARALIGKVAGDVVEVQAPGGAREVEIVSVRYMC